MRVRKTHHTRLDTLATAYTRVALQGVISVRLLTSGLEALSSFAALVSLSLTRSHRSSILPPLAPLRMPSGAAVRFLPRHKRTSSRRTRRNYEEACRH